MMLIHLFFNQKLLSWYARNKRSLPWRHHPTPYHVLVSEIMLQQTPVSRVLVKFKEFTEKFPTLPDLARASRAEVIQAWSGMGYNRRALLLHKFAQVVIKKKGGIIPYSPETLRTLPGIGPYTAGAIASFAYNQPEPAIDVNVRRIYMRFFHGKDQGLPMGKKEEQQLYQLVKKSIPLRKSNLLHNALMDFGSLVCTRDTPQCGRCPLQSTCAFYPLYQQRGEKILFPPRKRQEPGVYENGKFVPNRIFRGRLVEWVRKNEKKGIPLMKLGKAIKEDFKGADKEWILSRCEQLRKDRLVNYHLTKKNINLELARD